MLVNSKRPTLLKQLTALEEYLGRTVPPGLRNLYLSGTAESLRMLPVTTGREYEPPSVAGSDAERFENAQTRFASILGHAIGNQELARSSHDHAWPHGLLVIDDAGCGVYRAVDLEDSRLRVIEYQHLDPIDEADVAAGNRRLAYEEPLVPNDLQHRFVVVADSLDEWVQSRL